ncbi:MAG: argininosuccinate lyase [Candidatus ainarchaeum sp.]|nr:argininosuccinate lyase [Candidatus ainarchaeum sp.]
MKLWQKDSGRIDKAIEEFTVGNDYLLDLKIVKFDAIASIAHAKMLKKIGIFNKQELPKLEKALKEIIVLSEKGKFIIKKEDEDCHTAIENYLTKKIGTAGKKIHTARSRNDQVLVAIRLYAKEEISETKKTVLKLIRELKKFCTKFGKIKMPGYTHMQKAMPSSFGLWADSFTESLESDLETLEFAKKTINQNPLGSAAGYGLPFKIDRELTTKLLGFEKTQKNPVFCQNSRGKFESTIIFALVQIMLDLNKLATDLLLFSTAEFGFIKLPKEICTGSSIMPQKNNPDVLELIRAKSAVVEAGLFKTLSIIHSLPSGYNRDFQLAKEPLIESFETTKASINAMAIVIAKIKVNKQKTESALTPEIFAAQKALEIAKKGVPFREAYKKAWQK